MCFPPPVADTRTHYYLWLLHGQTSSWSPPKLDIGFPQACSMVNKLPHLTHAPPNKSASLPCSSEGAEFHQQFFLPAPSMLSLYTQRARVPCNLSHLLGQEKMSRETPGLNSCASLTSLSPLHACALTHTPKQAGHTSRRQLGNNSTPFVVAESLASSPQVLADKHVFVKNTVLGGAQVSYVLLPWLYFHSPPQKKGDAGDSEGCSALCFT